MGDWCGAADQLHEAAESLDQGGFLALDVLTDYGKSLYHCAGDEKGMQAQFRKATSLGLNDVWLLIQYGTFAAQVGALDSTRYWADKISETDPLQRMASASVGRVLLPSG